VSSSLAALAGTSDKDIKKILEAAGGLYASKNPKTWIQQAKEL
jgi:hypothetical protein